jgi:outer membrane protein assembly factor BamD (BamD/ComL family)
MTRDAVKQFRLVITLDPTGQYSKDAREQLDKIRL